MTDFRVAAATDADIPDVLSLLQRSELLTEGVRDAVPGFFVAKSTSGVLGCAGLEVHERHGLLRGVAVDPAARRAGIGEALVSRIVVRARAERLGALYLLTTTAADYFARLGFERVRRDEAPDGIQQSWEFRTGCPDTAVLMRRAL